MSSAIRSLEGKEYLFHLVALAVLFSQEIYRSLEFRRQIFGVELDYAFFFVYVCIHRPICKWVPSDTLDLERLVILDCF